MRAIDRRQRIMGETAMATATAQERTLQIEPKRDAAYSPCMHASARARRMMRRTRGKGRLEGSVVKHVVRRTGRHFRVERWARGEAYSRGSGGESRRTTAQRGGRYE